jgi:hypothetical protein
MEPIREVSGDVGREQRLANFLQQKLPWHLFPTPKFYFTDYHINRLYDHGRMNYIGDLEIKWLNSPSTYPAIFPFNKLQQLLISPPYTDSPESYHRICFRFTDGIMMLPAKELARLQPKLHTRKDTNETDMVIWVKVDEFIQWYRPFVVN